MKIIIFGADGYLGWPTAMKFASDNHEVIGVDNYLRRKMAKETNSESLLDSPELFERSKVFKSFTNKIIKIEIGDCTEYGFIKNLFKILIITS